MNALIESFRRKWAAERARTAYLALADGAVFHGVAFGARRDALGEAVFNTGMSGYQEILTDPSYAGQFVTLTAAEIVAQVATLARAMGQWPNNIVVMGMGEPFMNYDATLRALRVLNCQQGPNIGARHITLSTCGIVPGIRRLAQEGVQFELSVSLHAPNDALRSRLMPVNRRFPLAELLPACDAYTASTGRIITYEYTLVHRLNDRPAHAAELIGLLRGRKARVNLIPLSPVAEFDGQTPPHADCLAFLDALLKAGIHTTMRRSRGKQADAACGQLRLRKLKESQHGTEEL